jgi:hypothetical protein
MKKFELTEKMKRKLDKTRQMLEPKEVKDERDKAATGGAGQ